MDELRNGPGRDLQYFRKSVDILKCDPLGLLRQAKQSVVVDPTLFLDGCLLNVTENLLEGLDLAVEDALLDNYCLCLLVHARKIIPTS